MAFTVPINLPENNPIVDAFRSGTGSSSTPQNIQQSATEMIGFNEDNWLNKMIDRANSGEEASIQWLANYFATKESEKSAREWTALREDNAYQRLNEDLRKAGLTPYILSGATPMVSSSSGKSYSGSQMVSQASNEKTNQTKELTSLLALLGIFLTATARLVVA